MNKRREREARLIIKRMNRQRDSTREFLSYGVLFIVKRNEIMARLSLNKPHHNFYNLV